MRFCYDPTAMRDRRPSTRWVSALVAAAVSAATLAGGLAAAQDVDVDDLRQQREDLRREAAEIAAELDALAAEDQALQDAIDALDAHIALQEGKVAAAEDAIADAERRAEIARDEAAALDDDMERIRTRLQSAVINAFVAPRIDALSEFDSQNLLQAEIKQSYIDEVVGDEMELLDDLRVAQSKQNAAETRAKDAAGEVEASRSTLADKLAELDDSRAEAERLREEVGERVVEWQAVGVEIDAADAAVAVEIRELEAELARQAAAEEARRLAEEEEARRLAEEEANADDAENEDPENEDPADEDPPPELGPFQVTHRPVPGVITSSFGSRVHPIFGTTRNHYGIDFDGDTGDPISAAAPGVVLSAGWMNGYGNTVVISHGDGFTTLYAHQDQVLVSSGDSVSGGDVIGRLGSTGWSTGPHLHWEIRVDGVAFDPALYL